MTDAERIVELENIIGSMTAKAQGGICQFTSGGKHAFLKDIVKMGEEAGFDILGHPTDPEKRKSYLESL